MSNYIFNKSIKLAENAMLKARPELFDEWDFEKNDELGLDIYKVTKGSNKKVNWKCKNCNSHWFAMINNRTKGRKCPYCRGLRVNRTNSLKSLNPELTKEWHPTKNGELTPDEIALNSHSKVWWLGACGHEWDAVVSNRNGGRGCPYCSNKKILIGFNDMWTTNPELAKQLASPEDGYKYTSSSNAIVDWKCSECNTLLHGRVINNLNRRGFSCPKCSDGISLGERMVMVFLNQLNINYSYDISIFNNKSKRYDFYLPEFSTVIEVHGAQHYRKAFDTIGGRTLEQEKENDRLKELFAKENGIKNYIIVDARNNDMEWIKKSIINSNLLNILDASPIDWNRYKKELTTSMISLVAKSFVKYGYQNIGQMSLDFKLSHCTINRYLKMGAIIGMCNYNPQESKKYHAQKMSKKNNKKVVQLSIEMEFISEYSSIKDASNLTITKTGIGETCKGNQQTAGGFKWMYKEDYENIIKENNTQKENLL